MTARSHFRKTDLTKAVKAAQELGLLITGIDISREGDISLKTADPVAVTPKPAANDPFAKAIEEGRRQYGKVSHAR